MSASNELETKILELLFKNLAFANIGDSSGLQPSGAAGNFYIGLHTSDPGEAGDQTTNEATYTSYARVAVVRSGSGWTISGDTISNAATVTFPTCTGGSNTITHFSIGTASSGAGHLLFSGALTNSVAVSLGNPIPTFAGGALTTVAA